MTKRIAEVQRKGIKPSRDRKYKELVRTFREFLKSEIGRHINRLIQNFGKRFVREKLKRMQEMYGIEVIKVKPCLYIAEV